ncbi:nucleotide-binding universal stress UspA family protein [Salana multivorans]|uniref:Nucleotide-binding universal stress UspA family protein n=1 Tax=Salana multivorans TaxID=120377 RepID=A0A3N2D840_9MICO|nr:universal stress protein [Salana multivorans]OJX93895.1 MAG: universal stress protein [Micrococcales bacterium 73-15]ROR95940.1 nucleotide-binding universal stress UspA family protein [Salana multivorans]
MTHATRVAVGVDGSASSEVALEWALQEAARRGWGLDVICSYSLPSFTAASLDGGYAALDDTAIRASAQAALDEAVAQVSDRGVEVTGRLETGDPAGALIDATSEAGLVVIGTRGGGGFTDRLLGTVSTAVPAHAHCPVVVVPVKGRDDAQRTPVTAPRRIVVGVDGSPSARIALAAAIEEAVLWDAELVVVGGVPLATGSGVLPWLPANVDRAQLLADVEAGLKVVVEEVRAASGHDLAITSRVLDGSGAALLIEFSTAVDLVVVGSRGRGGFAGMLLGSTSQSVLHHAACPVLVVPARIQREEGSVPGTFPWEG